MLLRSCVCDGPRDPVPPIPRVGLGTPALWCQCGRLYCLFSDRGAGGHRGGSRVHGRQHTRTRPPRRPHGPRDPAQKNSQHCSWGWKKETHCFRDRDRGQLILRPTRSLSTGRRAAAPAHPHVTPLLVCSAQQRSRCTGPAGSRAPILGRRAAGAACHVVIPPPLSAHPTGVQSRALCHFARTDVR